MFTNNPWTSPFKVLLFSNTNVYTFYYSNTFAKFKSYYIQSKYSLIITYIHTNTFLIVYKLIMLMYKRHEEKIYIHLIDSNLAVVSTKYIILNILFFLFIIKTNKLKKF